MRRDISLLVWLAGVVVGFCCPASPGANVALWSQTSPSYVPPSDEIRDKLAIWPPEVAKNLTYYVKIEAPTEMAGKLGEVLGHAMSVWESAANITFVPVADQNAAHLVVNIEYHAGGGHYHGGGNAWPPVRRADGTFETSHLNLYFGGEPDQATDWREESWVWTAAHELGHALGLWHEFERPDRDQYIRMYPGQKLLPVIEHEKGFTADTALDYASLMMYAWTDSDRQPYYYLASPDRAAIPLPTVSYYQRNGLSVGDAWIIQWLYGKAPDREPMVHQEPRRDDTPLVEWQKAGWNAVNAPGTQIYGCDGWVVIEAEYGLNDHWTWGGNPPRLEKRIDPRPFQMSVEVKAEYVPAQTHAGIFVILGPKDWIYFGSFENPRQICVQRTGQGLSPAVNISSNSFQLHVLYTGGRLSFACTEGDDTWEVGTFTGLPVPGQLGMGIKTWDFGELGYRRILFRNVSFSLLR